MTIPSSGPISLYDLQSTAGGTDPISITEYYRDGAYIDATWIAPNVPTSGTISLGNFYGVYVNIIGQAEYTTAGTYTWVCPANVFNVSVLCVGAGAGTNVSGGDSSFSGAAGTLIAGGGTKPSGGAGTTLSSSLSTGTVGGGNGGNGLTGSGNKGGGGAGGYTGNGGNGNRTSYSGAGGGGVGIYGGTGAGGGGGFGPDFGVNTRGAGASGGEGGGYGVGVGGNFGGGAGTGDGGYSSGCGGGGLRYVTSYATTPGASYTVVVGSVINSGGKGAVRIIWGSGRAYPNTNTANA